MPEPIPSPTNAAPRLTFLDNLRTLMVLLVVVLHATCAYSIYTTWWTVDDTNAVFFDVLLSVLDVFVMPVLFFIAGYFALPSVARKGTPWGFTVGKLKRLGIPLLLGVLLVTTPLPFLEAYLDQGNTLTTSFSSHSAAYLRDGLELTTGTIQSTEQFNQGPYWFVSLLLFFFLILAGWRALRGTVDAKKKAPATRRSMVTAAALVAILTVLGTLLGHGLFSTPENPEPWVVIGNILQFQPTRLSLYILFFLLGLHAWNRGWFGGGRGVGSVRLWAVALVALLAAFIILSRSLLTTYSVGLGVAYLVTRCLLCLTFLFFFLSAGGRNWNTPTRMNTSLAASSYDIYLTHFPVVIGLQALLFEAWPQTTVYLKFAVIAPTAIGLCYGLSRRLIHPHPRLAVGAFIGGFLLALLLVGP